MFYVSPNQSKSNELKIVLENLSHHNLMPINFGRNNICIVNSVSPINPWAEEGRPHCQEGNQLTCYQVLIFPYVDGLLKHSQFYEIVPYSWRKVFEEQTILDPSMDFFVLHNDRLWFSAFQSPGLLWLFYHNGSSWRLLNELEQSSFFNRYLYFHQQALRPVSSSLTKCQFIFRHNALEFNFEFFTICNIGRL